MSSFGLFGAFSKFSQAHVLDDVGIFETRLKAPGAMLGLVAGRAHHATIGHTFGFEFEDGWFILT